MKFFFGNLICAFCMIMSSIATAQTSPKTDQFETIQSTYIQIDRQLRSQTATRTVSLIDAAQRLTAVIGQRVFSLLSWSSYDRQGSLTIPNYDRKGQFGRWITDSNSGSGCLNTRAKVLMRDSTVQVELKEPNNCVVDQGRWLDPYTGAYYTDAADIQIDHMVPLKNAYVSGAHKWNYEARCLYANYMGLREHLLAVEATENLKKSDKTPEMYIPPNSRYTCAYLKNWLKIKFMWGLEMAVGEARAIRQLMTQNNCATSQYVITEAEYRKQIDYARANKDICSTTLKPSTNSSEVAAH